MRHYRPAAGGGVSASGASDGLGGGGGDENSDFVIDFHTRRASVAAWSI